MEAKVKKTNKEKKVPTAAEIRYKLLLYGSKKTFKEMSEMLKVSLSRIAGVSIAMKKDKKLALKDGFFYSDVKKTQDSIEKHINSKTVKKTKKILVSIKGITTSPKKEKKASTRKLFTNFFGEGKVSAREFMIGFIKSILVYGDVLCLPSSLCILEAMINEISDKFRFIACEREYSVFLDMIKSAKEKGLPMYARLCDLKDAIYEAKPDSLAVAILDYCGILSFVKDEITYLMINNAVKVGGLVIATVEKARDGKIIKEMGIKNPTAHMKTLSGRAILKFFKTFNNYKIIRTFEYKDRSPMIVVVMKRTK